MPLFRKQSAAEQTSLAPHDSKARLQDVTTRRRFMAKPCTPHLHCAARAALQAANPQCWGSRGTPLAFLLGFQRGDSLWKENPPFDCALPCQWETTPRPLGAISEEVPCTCTSATMSCCQKSTSSASLISRSRRNRREHQNFLGGRRTKVWSSTPARTFPSRF